MIPYLMTIIYFEFSYARPPRALEILLVMKLNCAGEREVAEHSGHVTAGSRMSMTKSKSSVRRRTVMLSLFQKVCWLYRPCA